MVVIPYSMTLAVGILLIGGSLLYVFRGVLDRETDYAGLIAIVLVLVAALLIVLNFSEINNGRDVVEEYKWSDLLGPI